MSDKKIPTKRGTAAKTAATKTTATTAVAQAQSRGVPVEPAKLADTTAANPPETNQGVSQPAAKPFSARSGTLRVTVPLVSNAKTTASSKITAAKAVGAGGKLGAIGSPVRKAQRVVVKPPVMSAIELGSLGGGRVAYIKVMTTDQAKAMFPAVEGLPQGINLYALHAADGTPLALTDTMSAAMGQAIGDELEIASIH